MMRHIMLSISVLFTALFLIACSGGDDPADGKTEPWMVGANSTSPQEDMSSTPDIGEADMPPPVTPDMTPPSPDMPPPTPDMAPPMPDMAPPPPDMAPPAPDMAPDMPPVEMRTLEQDLLAAPWDAIFVVNPTPPDDNVGILARFTFHADGTVDFDANNTREGKWEIPAGPGERVRVYDLEAENGGDPEEFFLSPLREADRSLVGLDLIAGPNLRIIFEQISLRSSRAYTLSSIKGTWKSVDPLPTDNGQVLHLGLRIDNTLIEYGVITENGGFNGFILEPGSTGDFFKGSYWFMEPNTMADIPSLAGEITDEAGETILYAPFNNEQTNTFHSMRMKLLPPSLP